jgi:hypothetical protein
VQVGVVQQIDRFLAVVLLRNIDARPVADAQAGMQVLEGQAEALAIALRPEPDVAVQAQRE